MQLACGPTGDGLVIAFLLYGALLFAVPVALLVAIGFMISAVRQPVARSAPPPVPAPAPPMPAGAEVVRRSYEPPPRIVLNAARPRPPPRLSLPAVVALCCGVAAVVLGLTSLFLPALKASSLVACASAAGIATVAVARSRLFDEQPDDVPDRLVLPKAAALRSKTPS